ncbi:hypothetical protein HU675_0038260 [Bradyrhizobium septentrionale]|uniref:hypothetical protein n=1 Tax=Bradyrhizobium septentrionale TaxID=1404411 RepID=UPI0015965F50|nr:hypothetical protein [Bradyrhizobium septentrionale]UGY23731.1 hypothetical protein HU675_0038260 [Bradyrhizobium septentrionale]
MNALVKYTDFLPHELQKSWAPIYTVNGNLDRAAIAAEVQSFLASMSKSHEARNFVPEMFAKSATFQQAGSPTTGLTYYDLELGAKFVYPVLTPLRNEIPRVTGKGGIQAAWRAVTGVNTANMRIGVSAGNRGGVQAVSTQDYAAAYRGIGLETNVDFEAEYAGRGFDDIRAIAAKVGLEATMIGEEALLLGGNTSLQLGITPTPTVAASITGGVLAAATYSVICVALAFDAMVNGSIAGGIQASITRANADGSSDTFGGGSAQKSVAATGTVASGTTGSLTATVAAVNGACGYAWFWGAAGSEVLGAITSINSVAIVAAATGTQTAASLPSSDQSTNSLVFDGIMTQLLKAGSNAYVGRLATGAAGVGTPLTSDGSGGIVEIDAALKDRWDNFRLSPDTIWVNSQEALNISKKILQGSSNAAQRFVFNSERDSLGGGIMVRTYLNRFSMGGAKTLDIRIHPNMPAGTIVMTSKSLPYPVSGIANVLQVRCRQDYYQIEWPLRTRKYESGVYADEVLQCYFPPAFAMISNIANG